MPGSNIRGSPRSSITSRVGSTVVLCYTFSLSSGCTAPVITVEKETTPTSDEYRYQVVKTLSQRHLNDAFIAVTFSGGGMRAASLAYGALKALSETTVQVPDHDSRGQTNTIPLVHEVDFASSISGGSVTAAYWALFGPENLHRLKGDFLYQNKERQLWLKLLRPDSLVYLPTPSRSRVDLLNEMFDSLYGSFTYEDLIDRTRVSRNRPYLVVSSTDMTSRSLFPFIQLQFDLLCADLNSFEISDAVTASASYPVVFTARTLENYRFRDPDCLNEALSQDLEEKLSKKRHFLALVEGKLFEAKEILVVRKREVQSAELRVNAQKLALVRATEQERLSEEEKNSAEELARKLNIEVRSAVEILKDIQNKLGAARSEQDAREKEHSAELWDEQRREAERSQEIDSLSNLVESIENSLGELLLKLAEEGGRIISAVYEMIKEKVPSVFREDHPEGDTSDRSTTPKYRHGRRDPGTNEVIPTLSNRATENPAEPLPVGHTEEKAAGSVKSDSLSEGDEISESSAHVGGSVSERIRTAQGRTNDLKGIVGDALELQKTMSDQETSEDVRRRLAEISDLIETVSPKLDVLETTLNDLRDELEHAQDLHIDIYERRPLGQVQKDESLVRIALDVAQATNSLSSLEGKVYEITIGIVEQYNIFLAASRVRAEELESEREKHAMDLAKRKREFSNERQRAARTMFELGDKLEVATEKVSELTKRENNAKIDLERWKSVSERQREEVSERIKQLEKSSRELVRVKAALEKAERKLAREEGKRRSAQDEVLKWEERKTRVTALKEEHDMATGHYRTRLEHYGAKEMEFVHLFDGGAADNLGFTPLLEVLESLFPQTAGGRAVNEVERKLKHIAVISVDASAQRRARYERDRDPPNAIESLFTAVGSAIDNTSSLLSRELKRVAYELEESRNVIKSYVVNVSFDSILEFGEYDGEGGRRFGSSEVDLVACRDEFKRIETSWKLSEKVVNALIALGDALVRQSEVYAELVAVLGGAVDVGGDSVADVCGRYLGALEGREARQGGASTPSAP